MRWHRLLSALPLDERLQLAALPGDAIEPARALLVGAAVGGAVGTAMAMNMSKSVVSMNQLLQDTPPAKRGEIVKLLGDSFQEEFRESIQSNPELKLIMGAGTPIAVVRYMVDKELIQNEQMKRLDGILSKVSG